MMQFTFSPALLAQHAHPTEHPGAQAEGTGEPEVHNNFGEMLAESAQRHRGTLAKLSEGGGPNPPQAASRDAAPGERVGQHVADMLQAVQLDLPQALAGEVDGPGVAEEAPLAAGEQIWDAPSAQAQWAAPIAAFIEPAQQTSAHAPSHAADSAERAATTDVAAFATVTPSASTLASFSAEDDVAAGPAPASGDPSDVQVRSQAEVEAQQLRAERSRQDAADMLAREQAEASFRAALWSAPYPGMLQSEHAAPSAPQPVDPNEQAWQRSLAEQPEVVRAAMDAQPQPAGPPLRAQMHGQEGTSAPSFARLVHNEQTAPQPSEDTPAAWAAEANGAQQALAPAAPAVQQAQGEQPQQPQQPTAAAGQRPHAASPLRPSASLAQQNVLEQEARALGGRAAQPKDAGRLDGDTQLVHSARAQHAGGPGPVQQTGSQAPAEPPRPIASEQLAAHLAQSAAQGIGHVRVRIVPEGLGELDVRVRVARGQVRLQIEGEAPELAQLIGRNMAALRESLGQHNLTLDELQFGPGEPEPESNAQAGFAEFFERHGAQDARGQQDFQPGDAGGVAHEAQFVQAERPEPTSATRTGVRVIDVTL